MENMTRTEDDDEEEEEEEEKGQEKRGETTKKDENWHINGTKCRTCSQCIHTR
jgi:hypothetical protein